MNGFVLSSTCVLTLLLMVGLLFFIRASVKDRTQKIQFIADQSERSVLNRMETYLTQRAYRLIALDREQDQVTYEGMVRPSVGLAIFLMMLCATGLVCAGLVLAILFPQIGLWFMGLVVLTPLTGWFYWQQAQRLEQVCFKVESWPAEDTKGTSLNPEGQTLLTVTAHRDELTALKATLPFRQADPLA